MSETPMYHELAKPSGIKIGGSESSGAPIAVALDGLQAVVANLDDTVDRLINKIGPVTGPDMETATPNGDPKGIEIVPTSALTDTLNSLARRLGRLERNIASIHRRVEL